MYGCIYSSIPKKWTLGVRGTLSYWFFSFCFSVNSFTSTRNQFNNDLFIFTGSQAVHKKEYWRFFTYCFVHGGLSHLVGNMCYQILIGIPLEYVHGSVRVGLLYRIGRKLCSKMAYYFQNLNLLKCRSGCRITDLTGGDT